MAKSRKEYFRQYDQTRAERRRQYQRERYQQRKIESVGGRKCTYCGKPIPAAKRADAVYCSANCRVAARRQRDIDHDQERRRQAHARRREPHADYMREYMRRYRAQKRQKNKAVDRSQG